jgi:hypothetical protein
MYNYTFEGQPKIKSTSNPQDIINFSKKKNFIAFEWESVENTQYFGRKTKIRQITIKENKIIPNKWHLG